MPLRKYYQHAAPHWSHTYRRSGTYPKAHRNDVWCRRAFTMRGLRTRGLAATVQKLTKLCTATYAWLLSWQGLSFAPSRDNTLCWESCVLAFL